MHFIIIYSDIYNAIIITYCYSLHPSCSKVKRTCLAWVSLKHHRRGVRKKCPVILGSKYNLCSQINLSNLKETMDFKFLSPLCNWNIFFQGWAHKAQKQLENKSKWRPQMGTGMRKDEIVIILKRRKLSPLIETTVYLLSFFAALLKYNWHT